MASQALPTTIEYRRIRVPRENHTVLQIPPAPELATLWNSNVALIAKLRQATLDRFPVAQNFAQWQTEARTEVFQAALQYSERYLASSVLKPLRDMDPLAMVMSGHQPELFHPGVWYKNFALSSIGQRLNAVPINLVVDSDLCTDHRVTVPVRESTPAGERVRFGFVEFDDADQLLPHEQRTILNLETFASFPLRVQQVLNRFRGIPSPAKPALVHRLWEHVQQALAKLQTTSAAGPDSISLGASLAAGRHRLESDHGLRTLELPISQIARTNAFARFTAMILSQADVFQSHYNEVLGAYRRVHKIRSQSHPVPALRQFPNQNSFATPKSSSATTVSAPSKWFETPFWIWRNGSQQRRPLVVSFNASQLWISDLHSILQPLPQSKLVTAIAQLQQHGIQIRPRALTTTLFSRLLVSDLFLHGIGGAKYDQLTDAIAARFFGVQLPDYMTLSASFWLPGPFPVTRREDLLAVQRQRRNQRYHPETLIGQVPVSSADLAAKAAALIAEKASWVTGQNRRVRSKAKHEAIANLNRQLELMLPVSDRQLAVEEANLREALRQSEVISSREYSFCLFDESLVEDLKQMALFAPHDLSLPHKPGSSVD